VSKLILACVGTFLLVGAFFQNHDEPPAFTRGPVLALGGDSCMTVVWSTPEPTAGAVQFGTSPALGSGAIGTGSGRSHVVTLRPLLPDTRYYYRVLSGGDSTPVESFVTFPRKRQPFTFAVYGDTRSDHVAHVRVLRSVQARHPLFVVNTGDLVGSNTEDNWHRFFADLCDSTRLGRTAPYFATPGNHESGTMYYQEEVLPENNPARTEEYYSFDVGGVHLVAVNSEIQCDPGSPQYRWLVADLRSPQAQSALLRIAYWHRPPFSTSHHGSDQHLRAVLAPLMEKYNVALVFNGHDHCYERTKPIGGTTYIVTGGGGAPLYDFGPDSSWVAYKEKTYHFCTVSVVNDTVTVRMIRADDGAVRDSLILPQGEVQ
jgi:3',5'-cyclic AMP phosphodiesterase CpdA